MRCSLHGICADRDRGRCPTVRSEDSASIGDGSGAWHRTGDRRTAGGGWIEVVCLDIAGEGTVVCDIGDAIAVDRVAAEVGPIDVLVNNTGVWRYGDLANTAAEELERVIRVNLLGTMNCTRSFGKGMVARGAGAIVNIASISAIAPSPSVGAYSASKAGVVALTQQTALDWGPHGIRCNAVGPGMIRTESTASAYQDPVVEQARANAVPSGTAWNAT